MTTHPGAEHRPPLPFPAEELDGTVTERLARVAARLPDGIAVRGDVESCSYQQLEDASQGLARWMRLRLGPGSSPIAQFAAPTTAMVAVELASIAAGRPSMPLDSSYPTEHLAAIVERTRPAAIVVTAATRHLPKAIGHDGPVWEWESIDDLPWTAGDPVRPAPDDGTYVLFTSGTTGRPKGVILHHGTFLHFCRDLLLDGIYRPSERVGCAVPLAFGAAVSTRIQALMGGAELHLFALRERGVPAFVEWLRAERIAATPTVPTIARAVAATVGDDPLPALRTMLLGGETINPADIELVRGATAEPIRLVTLYATTELMLVSWSVVEPEHDVRSSAEVTVGHAVAGFDLELEPRDDDPAEGEIVVVGPSLNNGYLDDPPVPSRLPGGTDPAQGAGPRRHRTGDIGRRIEGGIVLTGRVDDMVKIRGARVELGLVERSLSSAPGVGTAAAVVVETADGGRALVGHVAPGPRGPRPDANRVRGHLRTQLPPAMVPLRVIVHDLLPQLPNGKVDRVGLAAMSAVGPSDSTPPRDELERRLLDHVQDRTGLGPIGVDQDLFELGVDSFTAIELLVHLEEEYGVSFPASSWIDLATIADLARAVRTGEPAQESAPLIRIQPGDADRPALVLAHDLHGTALRFRELAAGLGADLPVWGLDSPLLDGRPDAPTSIPAIAAIHAVAIADRFPDGPIHLLGYSWGTLLTVELVRELERLGRDVGFVGLVDFGPIHLRHRTHGRDVPRPPDGWRERAPSDLPLHRRVVHHVDRVRALPADRRGRYLSRVVDLTRRYDLAAARLDLRRTGRVRAELRGAYAWHRHVDLAHGYVFRPLAHDVDLFVSDQTRKGRITKSRRLDYASATRPLLGWDDIVQGAIREHALVGPHNDLVESPYVAAVAEVIRDAFDKFLAASGTAVPVTDAAVPRPARSASPTTPG